MRKIDKLIERHIKDLGYDLINQIKQNSVAIVLTLAFGLALMGVEVYAIHHKPEAQPKPVETAAYVMLQEYKKCVLSVNLQYEIADYTHSKIKDPYVDIVSKAKGVDQKVMIDLVMSKCAIDKLVEDADNASKGDK